MSPLDTIVTAVASRFELTPHQLKYGSGRSMSDARHAVYWVASQRGMSGKEIADWFGMEHSAVQRGMRRMESLLAALVSEGGE